jgi:hypothetical protein
MVRIIPSRLKSYGGNTPGGSRSSSPAPPMHRREHSPGVPGPKVNGLMLRIVVLRVRAVDSMQLHVNKCADTWMNRPEILPRRIKVALPTL